MLTYEQSLELYRLASVLGTARVIKYRAEKNLITTVTPGVALDRCKRAEFELITYIDSLREPTESLHPDNVSAADTWKFYVDTAKGDAPCE